MLPTNSADDRPVPSKQDPVNDDGPHKAYGHEFPERREGVNGPINGPKNAPRST